MVRDLKEFLHLIVRDILIHPNSLNSGKKFKNIGLTAREVLGLFLVCVVGNYIDRGGWAIASDPDGYDGVIVCKSGDREGDAFGTEQVYIPNFETGDLTDLILDRITKKSSKGKEYGKDRHLIIFCNKLGLINHQKIKKSIMDNDIFYSYWIIGKCDPSKWIYFVASPKTISDPLMAYKVIIYDNFDGWAVKPLGRL